jgi:light-regulated signal transduction histidine kinase (bacteriophytochrome)
MHKRKDGSCFPVEINSGVINLNGESSILGFVRDITERKIAEGEIKELNENLEKKVIERTNELEKRGQELRENQKALLNLVEDLNEKSVELTKKSELLQLSNKELETFSYSVSHDLRAPLRAVNGFVKILLEDYQDKLDGEGKRLCKIIENNAMKMGQLIDDLLALSRLGRSEIRHMAVDMENLVQQTVADLSPNKKEISFKIGKLPQAKCDLNLIRQVWVNLISNAIKYSSLNEKIDIQIGSSSKEDESIYYIKDNGIGFDMNYAHKLFGVFQRLHNRKEFEGTGVGLAIVQQIISRHGGRVWAEGTVGKGATFYFSLPEFLPQMN